MPPRCAPFSVVHFFPRIRREEGGVVQAILDLCQLTAQAGHRVTLATCDAAEVPAAWNGERAQPAVVELDESSFIRRRLSRGGLQKFQSLLGNVDVVHLHTPWELSNLQLASLLRKQNVPYLVTVHGMLDDYCMRQKGLKKRIFLTLAGRRFLARATTIHFTAEAEKEQALPWIPGSFLSVVQSCAMDLAPYESLPGPEPALMAFPQLRSPHKKILFLSRIHPKKGVELLLEAGAILKRSGTVADTLIAGPGEEEYIAQLKVRASQLGLDGSIHFLGMVRGEVKLSLYELANVFVLPTHQENFGLVLPEALACGTPVVTTRGTDIWRELAEAGAEIVESQPQQIADAIAGLLANEGLQETLGRRGRAFVMNWLAEDKVIAGYERMYRDAIGSAKDRSSSKIMSAAL